MISDSIHYNRTLAQSIEAQRLAMRKAMLPHRTIYMISIG